MEQMFGKVHQIQLFLVERGKLAVEHKLVQEPQRSGPQPKSTGPNLVAGENGAQKVRVLNDQRIGLLWNTTNAEIFIAHTGQFNVNCSKSERIKKCLKFWTL